MIGQDKNISFYFPAEGNIEASFSWVSVKKSGFPFSFGPMKTGINHLHHLICPPKFCISIVFNSLGTAVIPRKNEKQRLRKIWEVVKVHYGKCGSGVFGFSKP